MKLSSLCSRNLKSELVNGSLEHCRLVCYDFRINSLHLTHTHTQIQLPEVWSNLEQDTINNQQGQLIHLYYMTALRQFVLKSFKIISNNKDLQFIIFQHTHLYTIHKEIKPLGMAIS